MNKITLTVFALLVCVSAYAVFSEIDSSDADSEYSGKCGDNIDYKFDPATGVLSITGSGLMYDFGSYSAVPWYSYSENIRSVEITGTVESIGICAFIGCYELTSITLPETIKSIGSYAFQECSKLTSVTLGDSVDSIGSNAFQNCTSLTSVALGKSITSIGSNAFYNCTSLTSVTLGDSVGSIGSNAFYNCSKLTSFTIPKSVTSIGIFAFRDCTSLTAITVDTDNVKYSSVDGVLFDKEKKELIQYPLGKPDTTYTVPSTVKTIDDYAFYNCSRLASLTIGDSVDSIGNNAFSDCSSLTSVTLGDSVITIGYGAFRYCNSLTSISISKAVTTIGKYAFDGCSSLLTITVDEKNTNFCSVNGVLFDKEMKELILYPAGKTDTTYTIPSSVTTIDDYAFYGCTKLASVTFGDSVESIGYSAFSYCSSLTSVALGNAVTTIDDYAFEHCSKLTSFTTGNNVTTIGSFVFEDCTSLATVTLGNKVTTIGFGTFQNCSKLTSITLPASVSDIGTSAFLGCTSLTSITVDADNTSYHSENGVLFDKEMTDLIQYPVGKTDTTYAVPDSVTTIDDYAFQYCSKLVSLTLGNNVDSVGFNAFSNCTSLTTVNIPKSVTYINWYAFDGCTSLTSITVAADNADYHSENGVLFDKQMYELIKYPAAKTDTTYAVPDSVLSVRDSAFSYSTHLVSVTIPSSVTYLGPSVFEGCTSLSTITVDANNENYCSVDGVLYDTGMKELIQYPAGKTATKYAIPDSVESIGSFAFIDCTSLKTIIIPSSVAYLGPSAFYGCTSLKEILVDPKNPEFCSVGGVLFDKEMKELIQYPAGKTDIKYTIPDSVESIGSFAFDGCTSLTSIIIPDSVVSIGYYVFTGCTSLTSVIFPDSLKGIGGYAFDGDFYDTDCETQIDPTAKNLAGFTFKKIDGKWVKHVYSGKCGDNVTFDFDTARGILTIEGSGKMYDFTEISMPWNPYKDFIKTVIIADSVESIGTYAFHGCTSLVSVTIPASVAEIGSDAIDGTIYDVDGTTPIEPTAKNLAGSTIKKDGDSWYKYIYSGKCGDDVTFVFDDLTSTLTIDGSDKMYDFTDSTMPWYRYKDSIETLKITGTVTSIGAYAFYGCTSLAYVNATNTVTSIGPYSFCNCTSIKDTVSLGACVSIGDYAFSGCYNITSVDIDDPTTSLGAGAFSGCTGLKQLSIPYSLDCSGTDNHPAFEGCVNISKITLTKGNGGWVVSTNSPWMITQADLTVFISNGVPDIGGNAFSNCKALRLVIVGGSVTEIADNAFYGCSSLFSVSLPDCLEDIGKSAFEGCSSLMLLKLGKDLDSIGERAFYGCSSLVSVYLPDNITELGERAFENCTFLESIYLGTSLPSIPDDIFRNCSSLRFILIPDSVRFIGSNAFWKCTSLESVILGKSVKTIDDEAFQHCEALTTILIPDSVEEIGEKAFDCCYSLTSVIFGSSVRSIGPVAFSDCRSLTSLTIPDNVRSLGANAFVGCTGLKELTVPVSLDCVVDNEYPVFSGCNGFEKFTFTAGSGNWYAYGATSFDPSYYVYTPWQLSGSSLKEVTISDGVRSIGNSTFKDCAALTSLVIPDSVTALGRSVFKDCTGLKELTVPVSLDCVVDNGSPAFSGCVNFEKFTFTAGSGEWYAYGATDSDPSYYAYTPWQFSRSTLKEVTISDGVRSIGNSVFADCSKMVSVTIPASVTSIGKNVFDGCASLSSIDVNAVNTKYSSADGVLFNKDKTTLIQYPAGKAATSYSIPGSVTTIGERAFYDCTTLRCISIPSSVKSIGDNAFNIVFYDTDGKTKLEPTAANLAGSTFEKIDGKWVKQVPSSSDLGILLVIIAIFIVGSIPGIYVSRKNLI